MKCEDLENRFGTLKEIHHGQWANSYHAHDSKIDADVFIKILTPAFQQDSVIIKRFNREVELAGKIDHPNVVKLIDHGQIEKSRFICFEWLTGESLEQFIQKFNPQDNGSTIDSEQKPAGLTIEKTVYYARQILSGLSAIHKSGIIHRDLKPGNIIVDEDDRIHLLDFSLAYAPADTRITSHHDLVGTPGYLAPEVVAGGEAGIRSDLFAVGIIIYELLTGRQLFASLDIYEILQKVQDAEIPDISEIRGDIPPALKTVLARLLAPHPLDRYDGGEEALDDLSGIEFDPEVSVKAVRRRPRRSRGLIYVIPGVLIIISALILMNIGLLKQESPPTTQIEDSGQPDDSLTGRNRIRAQIDSLSPSGTEDTPNSVIEQGESTINGGDSIKSVVRIDPAESEVSLSEPKKSIPTEIQNETEENFDETTSVVFEPEVNDNFDSVTVEFNVKPWAKVYCEGRFLGTTPLLTSVKMLPDSYSIRFEHVDFPPLYKQFDLTGEEHHKVNVDLTGEFAKLDFAVKPWGYLFIDDIERGTIPLPNPIFIEPGEHTIRIHHPDFQDIIQKISISAGETLVVEETFINR